MQELLTDAFRAFSARLGRDPLIIQGPGGNTSIKNDKVMWIKASGMELADALDKNVFVAVDRVAAKAEVFGAGDGSCKATVLDPAIQLRPSIETTFHAALDWPVVAHSHSVATIAHVTSLEGRDAALQKLEGLKPAIVPYAKPGLPLTKEILARTGPDTRIILLENHGLICCGSTVEETEETMRQVEGRLALPADPVPMSSLPLEAPPDGYAWADESWMAQDPDILALIQAGSYYPDHVVFLGPALPQNTLDGTAPAVLVPDVGIQVKTDATPAQRAMLTCLSDVLRRVPSDWNLRPIGPEAEAELLDWDAEKYRQALAERT